MVNSFLNDSLEHKKVFSLITTNSFYDKNIKSIITKIIKTIENKNKVFLCGNGGSASDASHIASELSGKFKLIRKPLPVENLVTDLNFITAISNDFSYDEIFRRAINTKCNENDLVIFFTTSGNSKNIFFGIKEAKIKNINTVLVTGNIKQTYENHLKIPSNETARIQEAYMFLFHVICNLVEKYFFWGK